MFQFIPIQLVQRDEIVRPCDWHSNETVTLRKHVTKYENMWKWMVEFLRNFENSIMKIKLNDKVEQFRLTSLIRLELFEHVFLTQLVTGIATKPWLSWNMFSNIKRCDNGWSNFSENLKIVVLKLLELTLFLSTNISIYSYFL